MTTLCVSYKKGALLPHIKLNYNLLTVFATVFAAVLADVSTFVTSAETEVNTFGTTTVTTAPAPAPITKLIRSNTNILFSYFD
jgi:hypothetical protein